MSILDTYTKKHGEINKGSSMTKMAEQMCNAPSHTKDHDGVMKNSGHKGKMIKAPNADKMCHGGMVK